MIVIQIICGALALYVIFLVLKFLFGILAAVFGGIASAFKKPEPPKPAAESQRSYSSEEIELNRQIRLLDRRMEDLDVTDPADARRWRELNEEKSRLKEKLYEIYR